MIKKLLIENFRKYDRISFDDFQQINIFLGVNNVGKTTILESIMAFACGQNFSSVFNLSIIDRIRNYSQGLSSYQLAELILNTFHDFNVQGNLTFSFKGTVNEKKKKSFQKEFVHKFEPSPLLEAFLPDKKIVVNETGMNNHKVSVPITSPTGVPVVMDIPTQYLGRWNITTGESNKQFNIITPVTYNQFSNEEAFILAVFHDIYTHRNLFDFQKVYSYLMSQDILEEFIKELNSAFSGINIKSIDNIPYPDGTQAPISIRKNDGQRFPLYTLGDGVLRWCSLLGLFITYPNAVHCIEEADITLHQQAQEAFAVNVMRYAKKYNNQVFMSTHNEEFLKAFLKGIKSKEEGFLKNDIRVITLRNSDNSVKQRTLNGLEALEAIENGLELRV
jgi:AAA15 family ATPase/GTPase